MFNEKNIRTWVFVITLVGSSLLAWPVIQTYLPSIEDEKYTELFILGSSHEADNYPHKVQSGETYGIYAVVVNHRDASSYYQLHVKIRSTSDPPSNPLEGEPSNRNTITSYPIILSDEGQWEKAISFLFPEINQTNEPVHVQEIVIGDTAFTVDKTFPLNPETGSSKLGLFFELWILDEATSSFQYDNRFVEIWLDILQME
ncbi:DUF1616 domain-containing protein [Thermoproteota archaeon]